MKPDLKCSCGCGRPRRKVIYVRPAATITKLRKYATNNCRYRVYQEKKIIRDMHNGA